MSAVRARRAGFTLVELLVVIAIIAVLMAILFPVLNSAREKARQSRCMANLHEIAVAIRMYRLDEGAYPGPYDPVVGQGGLNALYPTYIPSRGTFICPDDPITDSAKYAAMQGPKPAEDADGNCKDYTDRDTYANLLRFSGQMYVWGLEDATGAIMDPKQFNELYSSYNLLYNYLGYVWFDELNDPAVQRVCTKPDGTKLKLPYKLYRVRPEVNYSQPMFIGDSISAIYAWYRWDPDNKLSLPDNPNDFVWVDEEMRYTLAMQGYWYDFINWTSPTQTPDDKSRFRYTDDLKRYLWDADSSTSPSDPGHSDVGLPSAVFPALINRNAPENTIITRCPYHRFASKIAKDIVIRLDGSAALVPGPSYDWAVQSTVTH